MKKSGYMSCSLLAASLLAISTCYAGTSSPYEVAVHCEVVSRQLEQLAYSNRNASCVENVTLSATYLGAAAKNLWRNNPSQALMHLNFASKELSEMYAAPQCAWFAPKIRPYLTSLIQLKVEMEMLDQYQVSKAHQ